MSDPQRDTATEAPLNPALKSRTDQTYDTDHTTPAPFDSASAKEGEGEGWPIVWLAVAVIGVILVVYFIL